MTKVHPCENSAAPARRRHAQCWARMPEGLRVSLSVRGTSVTVVWNAYDTEAVASVQAPAVFAYDHGPSSKPVPRRVAALRKVARTDVCAAYLIDHNLHQGFVLE